MFAHSEQFLCILDPESKLGPPSAPTSAQPLINLPILARKESSGV
jgi:hypothetical protein